MRKSITKTGIAMVVAAAVVLEGYGVKKSQHRGHITWKAIVDSAT